MSHAFRVLAVLVITSLLSSPFAAYAQMEVVAIDTPSEGIKNEESIEVIVKLKDLRSVQAKSVKSAVVNDFVERNEVVKKDEVLSSNIVVVESTEASSTEELIEQLENDPSVEYAEPNYKRTFSAISTNDTYKGLLWAIENTGQTVNGSAGTVDADMDVLEAWGITEGLSSIIVAVIDSGVDYTHPDLQNSMWDGTSCKNELGVTVGGCIHGYDYADNDADPAPAYFHGTHVAGTIAATKNNNQGVIGIAPSTKIMALKIGDNFVDVASEVKAIDFAIQNGAKIINASFGGPGYSQAEFDAMQRFKNAGGIVIAAASNDGADNDVDPMYPSNYNLDNIISVASTDKNDALSSFSNYGDQTVDVGAPGEDIASTYLEGDYVYSDGTSMAAPHVAGVVALVWAQYPTLTYTEVKQLIENTGDTKSSLVGKTKTGKRVNAYNAVTGLSPRVGYSENDVISTSGISYPTDGSGIVSIDFFVTSGLSGKSATVSEVEYSLDNGSTWATSSVGTVGNTFYLATSSLSTVTSYSGASQELLWNTKSIPSLAASTTNVAKVRFKAVSSGTTSPYAYTSSFVIDNLVSDITITSTTTSTTSDAVIITGNSEQFAVVSVYRQDNNLTQYTIPTSTNTFSVSVPAIYGVENTYSIVAVDTWGNRSATTTVSGITIQDITSATATLSGLPSNSTTNTSVSIQVGGDQVSYYKYKFDDGDYSGEYATTTNIALSNLAVGSHTISVLAKDRAGNWQATSSPTSHSWTITQPAAPRRSGGGGGGGGGSVSINTVTVTPTVQTPAVIAPVITSEPTEAQLIAIIQTLIAQIQALAAQKGVSVHIPTIGGVQTVSPTYTTSFTRDLMLNSQGEDVRKLQQLLNRKGFTIATAGSGSLGNESTYFGSATRAAVVKFQLANGISPASGYVGPATRAVLNSQ